MQIMQRCIYLRKMVIPYYVLLFGGVGIVVGISPACENPPDGYKFNETFNVYYKHLQYTDTWTEHEKTCQGHSLESHLVTINSEEKNVFVKRMIKSHAAIGFGRLDVTDPSQFQWVSGRPPEYTNWYKTEPNSEDQKCSLIYGGRGKHRKGFWHDVVCDWPGMHGICEVDCADYPVPTEQDTTTVTATVESTSVSTPETTVAKKPETTVEHKPPKPAADRTDQTISLSGSYGNLFLREVFKTSTDLINSFYGHGCWCQMTNTFERAKPLKGKPINELDFACRDWITCAKCNKLSMSMSCTGTESYEILVSSTDFACDTAQNTDTCAEARCQCDLQLAITVSQYLDGSTSPLEQTTSDECVRTPPAENPKKECCGSAPFYTKYSDALQQCVNGQVQDL